MYEQLQKDKPEAKSGQRMMLSQANNGINDGIYILAQHNQWE